MSKDDTILEIIPNDIIENDSRFFNYFKKNNEEYVSTTIIPTSIVCFLFSFAKRQIFYLNKYREFSRDKSAFDDKQSDLRRDCLQYWEIPDKLRSKECNPQPAQMALKSLLSKHVSFSISVHLTVRLEFCSRSGSPSFHPCKSCLEGGWKTNQSPWIVCNIVTGVFSTETDGIKREGKIAFFGNNHLSNLGRGLHISESTQFREVGWSPSSSKNPFAGPRNDAIRETGRGFSFFSKHFCSFRSTTR